MTVGDEGEGEGDGDGDGSGSGVWWGWVSCTMRISMARVVATELAAAAMFVAR